MEYIEIPSLVKEQLGAKLGGTVRFGYLGVIHLTGESFFPSLPESGLR